MGRGPRRRPRVQTHQLQLRIAPRLKALIERAARAEGTSTSEWVRKVVEQAAEQASGQHGGRPLLVTAEEGKMFRRLLRRGLRQVENVKGHRRRERSTMKGAK
jgi:uncharacterized protein (DUF1778 family)